MFCWILASKLVHASENPPLQFHSLAEGSAIVIGAASYFALEKTSARRANQQANPRGIDSWGHPRWNPQIKGFSDFMGHPLTHYGINAPVLGTLATGLTIGQQNGTEQGVFSSLIVSEAIILNGLITKLLKITIARPRPFTSTRFQQRYPEQFDGAYLQEKRRSSDAYQSMPSGHTSTAAATYFSMASLLHSQTQLPAGLSYGTAMLLTATTAWSRVYFGMHHPSDTLVGSMVGAFIGMSVVRLHYASPHPKALLTTDKNQQLRVQFGGQW